MVDREKILRSLRSLRMTWEGEQTKKILRSLRSLRMTWEGEQTKKILRRCAPQNDMGGRANEKDSSVAVLLRMTGEGAAPASAQKNTSVSVKRQRCFLKKLCGTTLVPRWQKIRILQNQYNRFRGTQNAVTDVNRSALLYSGRDSGVIFAHSAAALHPPAAF